MVRPQASFLPNDCREVSKALNLVSGIIGIIRTKRAIVLAFRLSLSRIHRLYKGLRHAIFLEHEVRRIHLLKRGMLSRSSEMFRQLSARTPLVGFDEHHDRDF